MRRRIRGEKKKGGGVGRTKPSQNGVGGVEVGGGGGGGGDTLSLLCCRNVQVVEEGVAVHEIWGRCDVRMSLCWATQNAKQHSLRNRLTSAQTGVWSVNAPCVCLCFLTVPVLSH